MNTTTPLVKFCHNQTLLTTLIKNNIAQKMEKIIQQDY